MPERKSVLVVSPDSPYPPNHGGRKDIFNRIKLLSKLGCDVHLVFTTYKEEPAEHVEVLKSFCPSVTWCRRLKLPVVPTLQSFQINSRRKLARIQFAQDFDVVILDGEYVLSVMDNPSLRSGRVFLRVNNDEPAYFRALARAATSPAKKLFFRSEAVALDRHIRSWDERIELRMFASYDEFSAFHGAAKIFLPPVPAISLVDRRRGRGALFVGNLFLVNNLEGLKWYLERVHPLLLPLEGYSLTIAGNTRGRVPDFLRDTGRYGGVTFHDSPEDLEPIYAGSRIFINPMLSGAGINVKSLDATVNGLPLVSTSIGCAGTGFKDGHDVLIGNGEAEFSSHIRALLFDEERCEALVRNAQAFLRENYDCESTLRRLLNV